MIDVGKQLQDAFMMTRKEAEKKIIGKLFEIKERSHHHPGRGERYMKLEITYNNGEKFTACLTDDSYENVMACILDDLSVPVMHSMGNAEEGE